MFGAYINIAIRVYLVLGLLSILIYLNSIFFFMYKNSNSYGDMSIRHS